jgi:hypothetical protein
VPYALGPPFAELLDNAGGNRRVDEAFREPPTTEEHLFDPASFLAGEDAEEVATGIDEDDVEESGAFGVPRWYLVLAERIDPFTALRASLGWDGDEYAIVERGGATCVRVVFRGDREEDEEEMGAAIDEWVAALPGGEAERVDVRGRPGIDACDPGPDVDLRLTNRSSDALVLPYLWASIVAANADAGPEIARCVAEGALKDLPYERVIDPDPDVRASVSADLRRQGLLAASSCGSGER